MKLTTRSRYGIRAILDLAKNFKNRPVSIKEISERQNISQRYLENIFHDLKNAGILESSKGKGGGFYLAKPLKDITVLGIIEILEGEMAIVECLSEGFYCDMYEGCLTNKMWSRLNESIRQSFANVNLGDVFTKLE